MARRQECGGCGSDNLEIFLDLGQTPLADAFSVTAHEHEPIYDLELAVCADCYLVQLMEIVDDQALFSEDYTFYSSASAPIRQYHAEYAKSLIKRFEQGRNLTVEIACNDGSLLRNFHEQGWTTLGIDPALGPLSVATKQGIPTLWKSFDYQLSKEVVDQYGQAGLVIANNVLAHVVDPGDFLRGIANLLQPGGVAVVEVQYLGDLIAGNMFDHVYHEHRYYFSLTT